MFRLNQCFHLLPFFHSRAEEATGPGQKPSPPSGTSPPEGSSDDPWTVVLQFWVCPEVSKGQWRPPGLNIEPPPRAPFSEEEQLYLQLPQDDGAPPPSLRLSASPPREGKLTLATCVQGLMFLVLVQTSAVAESRPQPELRQTTRVFLCKRLNLVWVSLKLQEPKQVQSESNGLITGGGGGASVFSRVKNNDVYLLISPLEHTRACTPSPQDPLRSSGAEPSGEDLAAGPSGAGPDG